MCTRNILLVFIGIAATLQPLAALEARQIAQGRLTGSTERQGLFLEQASESEPPRLSVRSAAGTTLLEWTMPGSRIRSAEIRNLNANTHLELIVVAESASQLHINLVCYNAAEARFKIVELPPAVRSNIVEYSLSTGPWGNPELRIIQRVQRSETVFATASPIEGALPILSREVFLKLEGEALSITASAMEETPLYILHSFIRSLVEKKYFEAYQYWASAVELDAFIQHIRPYTLQSSALHLENWHLHLDRSERDRGWITFLHTRRGGSSMLYQVFFKKINSKWKIISIRAAQEFSE